MRIKKDDTVIVIAGKDKGATGKVSKVFPKQNRVVVEGVLALTWLSSSFLLFFSLRSFLNLWCFCFYCRSWLWCSNSLVCSLWN